MNERGAHRVRPPPGEAAAVEDHHRGLLTQVLGDQALKAPENRVVLPGTLAQELLHGPHGNPVRAFELKDHRLDRLALEIRELTSKVERAPLVLCASPEQIVKE